MGAVTAREVLARLEAHGARLIAGASGLDRLVTWASAMRARPPAFEGLQSGELALLALGTLRALHAHDDSVTLARLVADLADRDVAALAVAGLLSPDAPIPDAPIPDTPIAGRPMLASAMKPRTAGAGALLGSGAAAEGDRRPATGDEIALADGLGIPLLGLPAGTAIADIERDVIAFVVSRRAESAAPEAPRGIYDALLRASLRGDDDTALGQRLALRLEVAVALEDGDGPRWCALPARFPLGREALLALLRRPTTRAALHEALASLPEAVAGEAAHLPVGRDLAVPPPASAWTMGTVVTGTRGDWPHPDGATSGATSGETSGETSGATSTPSPPRAVCASPLSAGLARLLTPLRVHDDVAASLSLIVPRDDNRGDPAASGATASRESVLAAVLEAVAPLFALALVRRHDLAGAERRLRTEALDALLTGTYPDAGQMRARAARLGHDLDRAHAALVVDLAARAGPASASGASSARSSAVSSDSSVGAAGEAAGLAADLAAALVAARPGTWARARADEVAALIPLEAESGPAALVELAASATTLLAHAHDAGHGPLRGEWAAGLGAAAAGPEQLRRSYAEARDAARLGRALLGPGNVARTADLGIYRLLLRLRDDGALAEFCERTLGPLAAEPRGSDSLLETLEVFFACNGNHSEAARRLHLHRNSLIYRLNRAHELLGQDLEDSELRLALQLALKGRRILDL